MLGTCLVLGGGGTSNPATEIAIELLLPIFALAAIWWPSQGRQAAPVPRTAMLIAGLALLVPVAQLVPLSPAIWHGLPGRQAEIASLALVGGANRWMPFTLTPARTFASLLAIIAELAVFIAAARLDLAGRRNLIGVIVGVAIISVLLGSLQISFAGGYTWSLYTQSNVGWVLGFHANRNAETDTLQVGIMALAVIIAGASHKDRLSLTSLVLLALVMVGLALAAILTGSRTGILLLPLTYVFTVWILWPVIARRLSFLSWWTFLIPPVACLALARTEQVQHALSRFGGIGERRWDIWHDTIKAIGSVWPLGGGISSFQVVYDASQSIERLMPDLDMRAHNDWLEWVLESGVPGIAVLTVIGLILIVRNGQALRTTLRAGAHPDYRAQVIFATGTLLHLGLHGLLDYPMRSMALAALACTAAALLMPLQRGQWASE